MSTLFYGTCDGISIAQSDINDFGLELIRHADRTGKPFILPTVIA